MGGGRAAAGEVTIAAESESRGARVPQPIAELSVPFTPRVAVLDIDGTLINEDLVMSPRTRDAVRRAVATVPLILATGRMYSSALPWAQELHVSLPLVCYQGALVRELPRGDTPGAVVFEEGLHPDVARAAIGIARHHGWHVQAYADDRLYCEQDRPEAHLYASIAQVPINFVDDLDDVVRNGSTKVVCVSEKPAVIGACIAAMEEGLGKRARVTRSMDCFVEVISPRINKALAIEMVCARLGLTLRDAVAVGDAPNDIEMLVAAGCGVAVRSARPEVLAAADATCGRPDEAGVADVLEHFGLTGTALGAPPSMR
ncbi:MAG: Cof-type HAD-IIB family hydrolase [Candidatus Dormibacteraeota bacterium]|nr:Cof-type HAD-IIB family hydrolase [Candidatus Dormibacteraeota bacterium]